MLQSLSQALLMTVNCETVYCYRQIKFTWFSTTKLDVFMLSVSCMQLTRTLLNKQRCVPQGDRHVSVTIPLTHSYEHIKFSKVVFWLQKMHFSLTAVWFPGRGKKFLSPPKRTNQLWCRCSLLFRGHREVSFTRGKAAGTWNWWLAFT